LLKDYLHIETQNSSNVTDQNKAGVVFDRAPASQVGDPGSNPGSSKNSYVKNG